LVWTNPAREWGCLNTGLGCSAVVTFLITLVAMAHPDPSLWGVGILWLLIGVAWRGLRAFHRWRLTPRRLPHRRRPPQ
jgi:hypothetical protein